MNHRTLRHRCGWFLVPQVTCVLAALCLLSTNVSGAALANDNNPPGGLIVNITKATVATSDEPTGESLATGAPPSVLSAQRIHRSNILNASGAASSHGVRGHDDSIRPLPKWCRTHVSSKFFAVRTFHTRVSVMGRAATGTVFVATTLLVGMSVFALCWCVCHSCKTRQKEVDPVAFLTPSSLSSSSSTSKEVAKNGYSSRSSDPPPPYDSCLQASTEQARPHETADTLQPAPQTNADQPPTYNAVVLAVASQCGAETKQQ